jgi:hypothetical protein
MTLDFETKRSTGASVTHISCRSFDSATSFARPRANSLTPGVLNVRAGVKMAEGGDPLNYKITGRSTLRPLTEPSMTYLRIRSIFGATAAHFGESVHPVRRFRTRGVGGRVAADGCG